MIFVQQYYTLREFEWTTNEEIILRDQLVKDKDKKSIFFYIKMVKFYHKLIQKFPKKLLLILINWFLTFMENGLQWNFEKNKKISLKTLGIFSIKL